MPWDDRRTVIYSYDEWADWAASYARTEEDHQHLQNHEAAPQHEPRRGPGDCPVCGWPAGRKGFLRARALPWEWAYGKLFACPRCWPPPLGRNPQARMISVGEEDQAEAARARLLVKGLGQVRREPERAFGRSW
ncbi:MAG: hypothetical protein GXY76_17010 [Chloroflexi bacterium]|nr:hypothetical protein [Chloroflexota bacterium]